MRRELLQGLERLNATTTILQRAGVADPLGGMWEAADAQWWWRLPRVTDELSGTAWMDADRRAPATAVDCFAIVDR